jgi:hypothetical protein
MYLLFGQIKRTVYSADDEAHKQQFSINVSLPIAISTFVNETYSPPRSFIKSFFRSTIIQFSMNGKKRGQFFLTDYFYYSIRSDFTNISRIEITCSFNFFEIGVLFCCFTKISSGDRFTTDKNFSSWMWFIRIFVATFIPIL